MDTADSNDQGILELRRFIGQDDEVLKFLHNTTTEALAIKIMKEGFRFENHLTFTADQVSGIDLVELKYFRMIRRNYGNYTIVIEIGNSIINNLIKQLEGTNYHFSEAMTQEPPEISSDGNPVYRLHQKYVKGYFDNTEQVGISNPVFDPNVYFQIYDTNVQFFLDIESSRMKNT